VIGLCTYLVSTAFMAVAGFSDPGTIPPSTASSRRQGQSTLPQEVTINGIRVHTKYCIACGIQARPHTLRRRARAPVPCDPGHATTPSQRPPRATHCRETNRCVDKWDHYCPWIGNSVGRRNYPFFVGFVVTTIVHCAFVGSSSFYLLSLLAHDQYEARAHSVA